jgi:hypothetical protein
MTKYSTSYGYLRPHDKSNFRYVVLRTNPKTPRHIHIFMLRHQMALRSFFDLRLNTNDCPRKFSVLSTSNSNFSPRSKTFSNIPTTAFTCHFWGRVSKKKLTNIFDHCIPHIIQILLHLGNCIHVRICIEIFLQIFVIKSLQDSMHHLPLDDMLKFGIHGKCSGSLPSITICG